MNLNTKHKVGIVTTAFISAIVMFTSPAAAAEVGSMALQSEPSGVVDDITNQIIDQLADIGTALLALYGLVQLIRLGISENTSGAARKLGIAIGLAMLLQSWSTIDDWINDFSTTVVSSPEVVDYGLMSVVYLLT